jgi:hypothetical protein
MPEHGPADGGFARWARGYGVIRHTAATRARVHEMAARLSADGRRGDGGDPWDVLHALDRVTSAAMWLVVHETYARGVYLDGRRLQTADFKARPEGHTGGALNMVPAYAAYLTANPLTGTTRAWLMGQGHCVAAVDSVNILVGNMTAAHAARYSVSDEGLTRYVRDFYSYRLGEDGRPDSPLGSYVNAHTAGGLSEGGYLGFAELQYVHMPLPGERLVAFLSDGAFEEQRGSDWTPRWWRAEDCGVVTPIMIKNGRRIDQRTTMSQQGGATWFVRHLRLNGFDRLVFDGRDPAAFVWAILEAERLQRHAASGRARERDHPLAHRDVSLRETPPPPFRAVDAARRLDPAAWTTASPMSAVDATFAAVVRLGRPIGEPSGADGGNRALADTASAHDVDLDGLSARSPRRP